MGQRTRASSCFRHPRATPGSQLPIAIGRCRGMSRRMSRSSPIVLAISITVYWKWAFGIYTERYWEMKNISSVLAPILILATNLDWRLLSWRGFWAYSSLCADTPRTFCTTIYDRIYANCSWPIESFHTIPA